MFQKFILVFICFSFLSSFVFASYDNLVTDLFAYHGKQVVYPDSSNYDVFVTAKDFSLSLIDSMVDGVEDTMVTYKDLSVRAYRFSFSFLNNSLDFFNSVVVTKDDMVLSCDKGNIVFPNLVSAKGEVRFMYQDYESLSDEAIYNLEKHYITLKGNASLSSKGDYVKGDKIIFDLANESVLSGGRSKIKLSTDRFDP